MSLKLAEMWVTSAFNGLHSARDAMNLFEKAAAEGVEATLMAAPELMNNGKCCLVHWTGHELVVLELHSWQQRALGINANTMIQELEPPANPRELPPIQHVDLVDVRVENAQHHDVHQRMTGVFRYETRDPMRGPASQCALRVKYFHPQRQRRVTGFSHIHLAAPGGELPFSYDPLFTAQNPDPWRGPVVLFFQLVAAQSWKVLTTSQRISNVLARVIEVA